MALGKPCLPIFGRAQYKQCRKSTDERRHATLEGRVCECSALGTCGMQYSQGFLSEPIFAMQLFPLWLCLGISAISLSLRREGGPLQFLSLVCVPSTWLWQPFPITATAFGGLALVPACDLCAEQATPHVRKETDGGEGRKERKGP